MSDVSFKMPEGARRLHFIGAGGISMSSLAAITKKLGYEVTGSDRAASAITGRLEKLGVRLSIGHSPENAEGADVVVYTSAIAHDNPELAAARERGTPCVTRAAYLGWLMGSYKIRIGVAGTHGKSTTTSMIARIMLDGGFDPTVVSGAELDGMGAYRIGSNEGGGGCFIFEACEYTDSFLSFLPTTAVITNVELDHVDYFHGLEQYIDSFKKYLAISNIAAVNADGKNALKAAENYKGKLVTFALDAPGAAYGAANIMSENGLPRFTLTKEGERVCDIALSVPGRHNIYNAMAAAAAALENGARPEAVASGLAAFGGAKRRFEYKGMCGGARVYDDYAHHPTEIKATLAAARAVCGGGRIICVFQPHSLSRTAGLFKDFTEAFGDADITVFTDIYQNLEHDSGGTSVTSADLAKAVKSALYIKSFDQIAAFVKSKARTGDLIVVMGAGSIYKLCSSLI